MRDVLEACRLLPLTSRFRSRSSRLMPRRENMLPNGLDARKLLLKAHGWPWRFSSACTCKKEQGIKEYLYLQSGDLGLPAGSAFTRARHRPQECQSDAHLHISSRQVDCHSRHARLQVFSQLHSKLHLQSAWKVKKNRWKADDRPDPS